MFLIRKQPPALTPGRYPGGVVDVKAAEGQYGNRLIWTVEILKDGHTYRAQGFTETTFYEGSTECRWASAALGEELKADEQLDEAELVGAPVMVEIATKRGRDGVKIFYNVIDILPSTSSPSEKAKEADVPF